MSLKREPIISSFPLGSMARLEFEESAQYKESVHSLCCTALSGVRSPTVREGYSRIMPFPTVGLLTQALGIGAVDGLLKSSVTGNPTIFKPHNPVAVRGIRLRVRHLNNRRAFIIEALEHVHNFLALRRMKI